jgi:hypothetical protein
MAKAGVQRLCAIGVLAVLSACATRTPDVTHGTGSVTVGVVTTGPSVANLAFRVLVDGSPIPRAIRADAGVLSASLPAGEHVLTLGDLPDRCRIDGTAERRVAVTEGRVAPVKFTVVCQ